ncbi:type II toxin-antitoxin system PemK/MazF family toxin [archaeon]|nr:type II toxin-antitoxin system PemK/MazF family toxin [archaeon]PJC45587.1 MAG: PemK family transcriptional regulator [Candidatus Pacearchaeota archaeon CG_4_9_14_0_2_um_filter_30_8]
MEIKRGDIIIANFEPIGGSEQGGIRPAIVVQNDIHNKYSPVTIVAAITSKKFIKEYPTNIFLSKKDSKLTLDSTILTNQLRTIDKSRIKKRISGLSPSLMYQVNLAIKISLDLD